MVLAGLALGVAASMADELGSGLAPVPAARAAGIVLNAGSIWAVSAILAGSVFRAPRRSAVGGALILVAEVAGYYGYGLLLGDRADVGLTALSGVLRFWLVAAVALGPALGVLGWAARRPDLRGLPARCAVPLIVVLEVLVRFRPGPTSFEDDPVWAWTVYGLLVVAIGAGVALTLHWASGRRRARVPVDRGRSGRDQ